VTESAGLATIDFLTHSKVRIERDADTIWPYIVDVESWRGAQKLVAVGGAPGQIGERFAAVGEDAPDTPLFHTENVELVPGQRRTMRLEWLDGSFIGFATWELTPSDGATIVAYDVYSRGPMLPPGHSQKALLADAQRTMDAGLMRLKAVVES